MTKRKLNIAALAVFALVFVLLLAGNCLSPLTADDFLFCFSRSHWSRITGADEIFPSLAALRQNTNGRVFAHFFVQFFLLEGKAVFNAVNALMGTLLLYILYRYVRRGEQRRDLLLLLFLCAAVFVLLPAFGQVFLWLTGSCNYSWTIVVTLGFLYPFFARYRERGGHWPLWLRLLYLPLAFVAGAWSENGSLAMLCAAFCFLALTWLREKRLPRFLALSFFVAGAGFLFLMLSPSELGGRRGEVAESTLTKAAGRVWALLSERLSPAVLAALALGALLVLAVLVRLLIRRRRLGCRLCSALLLLTLAAGLFVLGRGAASVADFVSSLSVSLLVAFCLWLLLMLRGLEKGLEARTMLSALVLGLAALASVLVFLFAVYFPARSACPFILYTTLADALLLGALWDKGGKGELRAAAALFCALALLILPLAARDIVSVHRQSAARDAALRELAKTPGTEALVEPITPATKYPAVWPGDEDYFNNDIALYYGLAEFAVTEYVNH